MDQLALDLDQRPERAARFSAVLAALVDAQERGDPIGLADLLEFELLPLLERFRGPEK